MCTFSWPPNLACASSACCMPSSTGSWTALVRYRHGRSGPLAAKIGVGWSRTRVVTGPGAIRNAPTMPK
eukprot:8198031-Pyramimonas_sp.AAC.1